MKPVIKSIDKHFEIKDKLIKLIEESPASAQEDDAIITKTDYFLDRSEDEGLSKYYDFFLKECIDDIQHILNYYIKYPGSFLMDNGWFQIYEKGDIHNWHIHEDSFYNAVYFLEFPEDGPGTEFYEPFTGSIFSMNVKEGDLLIFPSQYIHRSPKNQSEGRKTIIAFNINYDSDNLGMDDNI